MLTISDNWPTCYCPMNTELGIQKMAS